MGTVQAEARQGRAEAARAAATGSVDAALIERLIARIAIGDGARELVPVRIPFTGETLGTIPRATEVDVARAAHRARAAQAGWARLRVAARSAVLLRFHDLLLERREQA